MSKILISSNQKINSFLDLTKSRLGSRFEIEEHLTNGSYTEIYKARNLSPTNELARTVIVKALNVNLRGAAGSDLKQILVDNFMLETRLLKSFENQYIANYFTSGKAETRNGNSFYYVILENLAGGNLAQTCRMKRLSPEKTLHFAEQICSALEYIHAKGVLHRDIRPSNIMLSGDGRTAKLVDFSTARQTDIFNDEIKKVGTELYAAPERFSNSPLDRSALTVSADIYALAKTIYFVMGGLSPINFKQRQITSLPFQIESEPYSEATLKTLRKATSENPAERHKSATEFLDDLHSALNVTHAPRANTQKVQFVVNTTLKRLDKPVQVQFQTINFTNKVSNFKFAKNYQAKIALNLTMFGSRLHFGGATLVLSSLIIVGAFLASSPQLIKKVVKVERQTIDADNAAATVNLTGIQNEKNDLSTKIESDAEIATSILPIAPINKALPIADNSVRDNIFGKDKRFRQRREKKKLIFNSHIILPENSILESTN